LKEHKNKNLEACYVPKGQKITQKCFLLVKENQKIIACCAIEAKTITQDGETIVITDVPNPKPGRWKLEISGGNQGLIIFIIFIAKQEKHGGWLSKMLDSVGRIFRMNQRTVGKVQQ
jgi:hypothetical protein